MPPSHQQSQIMGQSDSAMMRARSTGVDTRAALEVERLAWWPVHACLRPGKVELLSAVVVVDGRTQSRGRHWLLLSLALFPSLPPPLIAHTTHTTTHFPIHPTPLSPFFYISLSLSLSLFLSFFLSISLSSLSICLPCLDSQHPSTNMYSLN
jgi:hypothetical protein